MSKKNSTAQTAASKEPMEKLNENSNSNQNSLLVIGKSRTEPIVAELSALEYRYSYATLFSKPSHWNELAKKIRDGMFSAVILHLTEIYLLIASNTEYRDAFGNLLLAIQDAPHIVYLYEDSLVGKYNIFAKNYYSKYLFYEKTIKYENVAEMACEAIVNRKSIELYSKHMQSVRELFKPIYENYKESVLLQKATALTNEQIGVLYRKIYRSIVLDIPHRIGLSNEDALRFKFDLYGFFCTGDFFDKRVKLGQSLDYLNYIEMTEDEYTLSEDGTDLIDFPLHDESWWFDLDQKIANEQWDSLSDEQKDSLSDDNNSKIPQYNDITVPLIEEEEIARRKTPFLPNEFALYSFLNYYNKAILHECDAIREAIEYMNLQVDTIRTNSYYFATYKKNKEIIPSLRAFVSSISEKPLFVRYVYLEELWSGEFEKLLILFQDYIQRVRGIHIYFREEKTEMGTAYFFSAANDSTLSTESFDHLVGEFEEFLRTCQSDSSLAIQLIENNDLTQGQKSYLISQYNKELSRILNDMQDTFEYRQLALKQTIRSQSREIVHNPHYFEGLQTKELAPLSTIIGIQNNYTITTQSVYGDVYVNEAEKQLLEAINRLGDNQIELIEAIKILKDTSLSKDARQKSHEKLKQFLSWNMKQIGEMGYKLLTEFLKGLIFSQMA